jgi:hypothetical protein
MGAPRPGLVGLVSNPPLSRGDRDSARLFHRRNYFRRQSLYQRCSFFYFCFQPKQPSIYFLLKIYFQLKQQIWVLPVYLAKETYGRQCNQACQSVGVTFLPLPVETLRGWHSDAEKPRHLPGTSNWRLRGIGISSAVNTTLAFPVIHVYCWNSLSTTRCRRRDRVRAIRALTVQILQRILTGRFL